ncbi:MAG TPA: putative O-glycosylation ligase, exosortase A system-associated, partial [Alteraurantiacibacter sp.]
PGLALWLWIHALGLWQMERIRRRMKARETPEEKRWYELATALQHGQAVYLVGALFVGIAYQPFVFYLVALQIALASLLSRNASAKPKFAPKLPKKQTAEPPAGSSPGEAPA